MRRWYAHCPVPDTGIAMRPSRQIGAGKTATLLVTTRNVFSEPQHGSHRKIIMRIAFTKKQIGLAAACALALGVLSATASAQQADEKTIVTDTSGFPVKDVSG